ncbi:MAG: aldo/keto reductase [Opitutaceae bacterium]|nr:aldo/keto reductase [Opitutaceae bacterium]
MQMDYVNFGRTGVKVSPLTLGCMMFGGKTDLDETCRIIDRALDAGINCIDTANIYSRGKSEEFTGEALKRNGRRDRVFLCTKVHGAMDDADPNMRGNSRRHLIQQCEASLRRLQTDHIDLYQIHRPQSDIPIDETLRALDDLVRAGKVRYVGTSTFAAWQIVEALWCAKEHHLNRFVSEQPPYNLLDRRIERELLPMCRTHGLATLPWSPLASGILSGKYHAGQDAPAGSRFADMKQSPFLAQRWNEGALQVVEKLRPLAAAKNVTLSQFALAWTIQQPGVTSPIIGPRTLEQLEDNLKATDVRLTAEELKAVDAIVPPGTHVSAYYEADFGPHLHRW